MSFEDDKYVVRTWAGNRNCGHRGFQDEDGHCSHPIYVTRQAPVGFMLTHFRWTICLEMYE